MGFARLILGVAEHPKGHLPKTYFIFGYMIY